MHGARYGFFELIPLCEVGLRLEVKKFGGKTFFSKPFVDPRSLHLVENLAVSASA
jgi:hypothetical protein